MLSCLLPRQLTARAVQHWSSATRHGFRHVRQVTCPNCQRTLPAARSFASVSQLLRGKNTKLFTPWVSQTFRQTVTKAAEVKIAEEIPLHGQKIVGYWLVGCAGMVFGAVILGGITRLTESGLSMVDWRLLKDMKPPQSEAEWQKEFERYKTFPEYQYQASQKEVTLSDFKFIYYMEWGHRMWGRGVGLAFLLPAPFFLYKGWISRALKPRLVGYAALIGFQGFLGWYMVKSGLEEKPGVNDIPRVSQYRLAAHLGSAFILYTLFLWQGFTQLLTPHKLENTSMIRRLRGAAHGIKAMVFFTAISGAFVAGLDAGLVYNSWPKMADRWIPDDIMAFEPKWKNVFENPTTVQFNHRHLGETTALLIAGFWWMSRRAPLPPRTRLAINCLMGMALIQATLGVSTLLTYVPTHLAATHQSGSLVLLSFAIWLTHELRRFPK